MGVTQAAELKAEASLEEMEISTAASATAQPRSQDRAMRGRPGHGRQAGEQHGKGADTRACQPTLSLQGPLGKWVWLHLAGLKLHCPSPAAEAVRTALVSPSLVLPKDPRGLRG